MPETTQQPMNPVIQGLLIGFFGSALYFAVDNESNRTVVFTLKFLVAISSAAVLLHQTGLFGHGYF